MCLKWFRKKPSLADAPYPKETVGQETYKSAEVLRQVFYAQYDVADRAWFDAHVGLIIDPNFTGAAYNVNDVVTVNPEYALPCVLAHEFCHSLYSKLTKEQQDRFSALLPDMVVSNILIKLAIKDYGNAASWQDVPVWEAHAQIYRFFGREMPVELFEFYPHLI